MTIDIKTPSGIDLLTALKDHDPQAPAVLDDVTDKETLQRALLVAATHNSPEIVRRLLDRNDVDPQHERSKALRVAAEFEYDLIVRMLYPRCLPEEAVDDLSSDGRWDAIQCLLLLSVEHRDGLAEEWVKVLGSNLPKVKHALEVVQQAEGRAERAGSLPGDTAVSARPRHRP